MSVAGLAALFLAPLGLTSASEAATAKSITISGSISGISAGKVLVMSTKGLVWTGAIQGPSFRVLVPSKDRAQLRDATVQVVSASGSYVGPVVLKKTAEKKNPACGKSTKPACIDDVVGLGVVSRNLFLGRLVAKDFQGSLPTWFLASKASSIDPRDAVRAATRSGRPYGAGNLGLVPGGIPAVSLSKLNAKVVLVAKGNSHVVSTTAQPTNALASSPLGGEWLPLPSDAGRIANESTLDHANVVSHGLAPGGGAAPGQGASPASATISESCPTTTDPLASSIATSGTSAGTSPGQELDCSGVPNLFNTDVNGNDVMNISDPSAASIAASAITIGAKVHTAESTAISYYAPGGISLSGMASFLDPVTPAIGDNVIFNFAADAGQLFPGDASGSDVTMSVDCGAVSWCANATLFNDATGTVGGPWSQASPPYAFPPNAAAAKGGGFGANVLAPFGTNVPAEIIPGQLIGVQGAQQSSGATTESMMEVGPYFATTPYVQGAKFTGPPPAAPNLMLADSAGNNVTAVGSNTLMLKVERPERLPLPGEATSSGVIDMTGLDYDVSIHQISGPTTSSTVMANCPATTFSNISGATVQSLPENFAGFALVDNTTQDFDPAASNNPGPIAFTLNPSACAASGGVTWTPGQVYSITITASGIASKNDQTFEGFSVKA
ncbi:MAG: hypothetical protein JWM85_1247 [Acidimicrobiaceae bacterium]|nr:hypothetical protein [Acidimicrobiaceae bacterium]